MISKQQTHERVELPLERLLAIEHIVARLQKKRTMIQLLYDKWSSGSMDFNNLVDTRAIEPMLFRLPNHHGRLSENWPTRMLKDFPAPDHGRMCAIEYAQCSRLARPMAHYIRHSYNLIEREYFRLVVPLDDGSLAYETRALTGPYSPSQHAPG